MFQANAFFYCTYVKWQELYETAASSQFIFVLVLVGCKNILFGLCWASECRLPKLLHFLYNCCFIADFDYLNDQISVSIGKCSKHNFGYFSTLSLFL